jgi:hypothetical protein
MRAWVRGALAVALALGGAALVMTAMPVFTGRPVDNAAGPVVMGIALLTAAVMLSLRSLRRVHAVRRDAKRGLRQIEMVLRLEAALAARRVTVAGPNVGCPDCGAPAGPHCVCRKH